MAALSVCVFCGSSDLVAPVYLDLARSVGEALGRRGIRLVYGGARTGLMGAVADATRAHGSTVLGVIPTALTAREVVHTGIDDLRVVGSMHARKALMADESDAFVALPGGFGTMDELFEIVTWRQIRLHDKPIALVNHGGFYDPLVAWIQRASDARFIPEHVRAAIEVLPDTAAIGHWLDGLSR